MLFGQSRRAEVRRMLTEEDAELAMRLKQLSAGQKICLSLVAQHFSSKEIALELGVSPHTVDQRIRAALRKLRVAHRRDAALLLLRHEGPLLVPEQGLVRGPPPARRNSNAGTNELSAGWRLTWIVVIAIGSAFSSGLVLAASESILSLVHATFR